MVHQTTVTSSVLNLLLISIKLCSTLIMYILTACTIEKGLIVSTVASLMRSLCVHNLHTKVIIQNLNI